MKKKGNKATSSSKIFVKRKNILKKMSTTEASQEDNSENSSIVPLPLGSRHVFVTHTESPEEIWVPIIYFFDGRSPSRHK